MEYFVKRVLPVMIVGVSGAGYYGAQRFMKYLDHQACSRNVGIDQKTKREFSDKKSMEASFIEQKKSLNMV